MKTFIEQARFYANYHQKPMTRYTHLIGVPLIVFSLMVFFGFLHLIIPGVMDTTLAYLLAAAVLIYYFFLNWRLTLALLPIFLLLLWLADLVSRNGPTATALWVFVWAFAVGWLLQLIGHFIEGRHPALMDNLWQALIAPLFLTAELFFMFGYMEKLRDEIYAGIAESQVIES